MLGRQALPGADGRQALPEAVRRRSQYTRPTCSATTPAERLW